MASRPHMNGLVLERSPPLKHQRKKNIWKKALEKKVEYIHTRVFFPVKWKINFPKVKKHKDRVGSFMEDGKT